jgi:pteridine reductase
MEIQNRIALVTGGAHRVGKAIALALAREGAHVIISYHTSAAQAAQTVQEIEALGVRSMAIRCDQRDIAQIDMLFDVIAQRFGRLDILVNNAAIMERTPVFDLTPADWDRVMQTNLRGPFFIAQSAARLMHPSASAQPASPSVTAGCIVNIADLAALRPWPSFIAHTVSKTGVVALTKALAVALAPAIRVNAVAPGAVLKPSDWDDERWQAMADKIPLQRTGSAEDVAQAVIYFIRNEFVTGELLVVDGGRELR